MFSFSGKFKRDQRGVVAVIFALALIPILLVAGSAVDYSNSSHKHEEFKTLLDAAILTGASKTDLSTEEKITVARDYFEATATPEMKAMIASLNIAADPSGKGLTGTLEVDIPTVVMKFIGVGKMHKSVTAEAAMGVATTLPPQVTNVLPFMDFYLLLDNSSSMGIGATQADLIKMEQAPIECAFGCHIGKTDAEFREKYKDVRLRIDVLRDAVARMVDTAIGKDAGTKKIKIGLYTFNIDITPLAELSSNLNLVRDDVADIGLNDGIVTGTRDGSQLGLSVQTMSAKIGSSSDGTADDKPRKFLVMVTDGVEDGMHILDWEAAPGLTTGGEGNTTPMDTRSCAALKGNGVIIAILYTTYEPFNGKGLYNLLVGPFAPEIPGKLKECASEGFFIQASSPAEIDEAMQAIFHAAVTITPGSSTPPLPLRLTK